MAKLTNSKKRKRSQHKDVVKKAKITSKNKRKRSEQKEEREESRWENLPGEIIMKIFEGIDHEELLMSQYDVCPLWRKACWDIIFWNGQKDTLDLSELAFTDFCGGNQVAVDHNGRASRLMWLLESIFSYKNEEDGGNASKDITCMVLPPNLNLCDLHLVFLSQSSRMLRSLTLPCVKKITGKGFSRAIRNWREMEEISIGPVQSQYFTHIIQEMGINFKKLEILCINGSQSHRFSTENFYLDEYKSLCIAKHLCNLKILTLNYIFIYKFGVKNILSESKQLSELNFTNCKRMRPYPQSRRESISNISLSWKIKKMTVGTHVKWSIDTQGEMCSLSDLIYQMWQ